MVEWESAVTDVDGGGTIHVVCVEMDMDLSGHMALVSFGRRRQGDLRREE